MGGGGGEGGGERFSLEMDESHKWGAGFIMGGREIFKSLFT